MNSNIHHNANQHAINSFRKKRRLSITLIVITFAFIIMTIFNYLLGLKIIFFHIFINIGMTIGIVPVIGIPLPFLSFGGTALVTFTVLLFVLIRLDADRQMILR